MTPHPHIPAFALSFLVSVAATWLARALATRFNVYAVPVRDRWHTRPVPHIGGAAIMLAFIAGVAGFARDPALAPVFVCSSLMFLLGLVDDLRDVRPLTKLICQMVIAGLVLSVFAPVSITGWPVLDQLLGFAWIIGITNAFNLLDNMDGLAAGIATLAGLGYLALLVPEHPPTLTVVLAAFVGAVGGFLVFNYPPASIFMGDGGSHFLGAFLATSSLVAAPGLKGQLVPAALLPVLILLVPIFDTTFVTLMRRLSGRSALIGGRDHTSHRLVALGASERVAVLSLYVLAATGGLLAISLQRLGPGAAAAFVGLYFLILVIVAVVLGHVGYPSKIGAGQGSDAPLLSEIAYRRRALEVLLDVALLTLAYYAAFRLRFQEGDASAFFPPFVRSVPIVVGAQVAGLYAAGKYRQVWHSLSTPELGTLIRGLLTGVTAAVMVVLALYRFEGFSRGVFLLDGMLAFFLLVAARAASSSIDEYLRRRRTFGTRALIYGAGRGGALLLRELLQNPDMQIVPIGFVDDDPRKQRLRIEGVPVLGAAADIPAIVAREGVEQILVGIRDLEPAQLDAILAISHQLGVTLRRMRFSVDEVRARPSLLRHER